MRFADYDITPSPLPNDGLMFADLVAKGRSGHLGHALVEYAGVCAGLLFQLLGRAQRRP